MLFFALCTLSVTARAQGIGSLDVITETNGDIHNGTLASESFTLQAPYGAIDLPYGRIKSLFRKDETVFFTTRDGERYSGRLEKRNFTVLRPGEPFITVSSEDIAEVEFGERLWRPRGKAPLQAFEMANGDRFRGHLRTDEFMVKTETGLKTVKHNLLSRAEIAKREDASFPSIRLTFIENDKNEIDHLLNDSLTVETAFGQTLAIKTPQFATLNLANAKLKFNQPPSQDSFRDLLIGGGFGPDLVIVQGGVFRHGDLSGGGDGDEKPIRAITLASPFAIGVYEVTFEQFDLFCEATERDKPDDSGWGRGNRPVINVSWEDAQAYTDWLSQQTGQTYRLPSDTEWEYAARGGTRSRFWWGMEVGEDKANCAGCGSLWDAERTADVGRFAPNPFGLYDTAGNVFEWAADCYHDSFAQAPRNGKPLEKEGGCGKRVIRGGAWSFPPKEIRSANRWRDFPTRSSDDTGFRVLRELTPGRIPFRPSRP